MTKEDYIEELEAQSADCDCTPLSRLFELRKTASSFVARRDFFKSNIDLENAEPGDMQFLLDYRKAVNGMHDAVRSYHVELTELLDNSKLKSVLHDERLCRPARELSFEETKEALQKGDPIITVYCSGCGQQIELVGSVSLEEH